MDDNKQSSTFDEVAANLNGLEMTDDSGQISEDEPSAEKPATQETNTFDETAEAEKAEEPDKPSTQDDEDDSETDHAVDEKGKRYIPEKRFKSTYAKLKQKERELAEAKKAQAKGSLPDFTKVDVPKPVSATDEIDTEILFMKYPQFDPKPDENGEPTNPDYSAALDRMGAQIYKANPGISRIKAAEMALRDAKALTSDQAKIVAEARAVKSQQSDQGITSRVLNRSTANDVPGDNASPEELEAYLRKTGQW